MASRLFSTEIIEFMGKHSEGRNSEDLAKLINSTFNTFYSVGQITSARYFFGFKSGIDGRIKKGQQIKPKIYSDEIVEFMKVNSLGRDPKELANLINFEFSTNYTPSQIADKRYRVGARSGITNIGMRRSRATEFKKGQTPLRCIQKGERIGIATEFKKGHTPWNHKPIGTVMLREDGYLWQKYAETKPARFGWQQIHRHNWEQANGKIPEDHKIIFLDGDKMNTCLENLAIVKNREMLILNQFGLIKSDAELTKVGVQIAKVKHKVACLKKKEVKNE